MPALPWTKRADLEPDREYLVLGTYLPLTRRRDTPRFMRMAAAVRHQLADADGLVGYSLLAQPIAKEYWTVSVWLDEPALRRFVAASPHVGVMKALRGRMGATRFERWTDTGTNLPPSWPYITSRVSAGAP